MRGKILLFSYLFIFSFILKVDAFIERYISLEEVVSSCTNIIYGEVRTVNENRMTAIIDVKEDILGHSGLKEIKINLSIGQHRQGSTPRMMIVHFKQGVPIMIFYQKHAGQIDSVGHTDKTWFQCRTYVGTGPKWRERWWAFTHIEIRMPRTYDGETSALLELVRKMTAGSRETLDGPIAPTFDESPPDAIKILVFSCEKYDDEFATLARFIQIDKYSFAIEQTLDKELPKLGKADILWIGQSAIQQDWYVFDRTDERRIKRFAANGGVVIVSGQDSYSDRRCPTKWFPKYLIGAHQGLQTDFQPTQHASSLFQKPNQIQSGQICIEDTWSRWSKKVKVLATTKSGKGMVVGTLECGKGLYIVTSLQNKSTANVATNRQMMENLLYFASRWLKARKSM